MLLLCFLWPVLPPVVSDPDTCVISQNSSSLKVSPVLESLQCYNDYQSYFHCTWKEERHSSRRLKLWFKTNSGSSLCENYTSAVDGSSQCRYKTNIFSRGTNYTAFFNETLSLCSSVQLNNRLNLSLLLRAQPPVNLKTSRTKDGDTLITWSSPYPESSSLNSNIIYKLRYRPHGHNNWTTDELSATQKRLEKKMLISGHRYEAQVKARVSMGQWSHWTALVCWHSELDPEQVPRVDCVVWGEQEVQCSWEQSTELVHFISYQLACRPNHTAPMKVCCKDPVVSPSHRKDALTYSCNLTLTQLSALPLLELIPTRNAKTFSASKNIHPYPPTQVTVREKGHNWIVKWTPPKMSDDLKFAYVVCYYSKQDEEDSVLLDIPGDTSLTILGSSLLSSQSYKVKVRAQLLPPFEGNLSDWSIPAEWTSHAAAWPISTWIYISVTVMVAAVFLTLYYTIPACRRRAVLWVDSLPSPAKSKIMSDVQTVNIRKVLPSENTYICKVLDVDHLSTYSSDASLWPTKSSRQDAVETDDGIWSCDNLPVTPVDTSSMSFSGPYILCQSVESKAVDDISDQTEVSCPDLGRPAPVNIGLFEEGYVCLPSHAVSRSIQDLTSQSQSSTSEQSNSSTEEDQHCPNEDHNSEPFWPQGGAIQCSGYCQLPTDLMRT